MVDGRSPRSPSTPNGYFVRPTMLEGLPLASEIARTEIFGPVLSVHHVDDHRRGDRARQLRRVRQSGVPLHLQRRERAKFRYEAEVGNVGINVGVAAPMAFFPFSGARESFFGDLHGQGRDAIEFFTQEKVVVERWPAGVDAAILRKGAYRFGNVNVT